MAAEKFFTGTVVAINGSNLPTPDPRSFNPQKVLGPIRVDTTGTSTSIIKYDEGGVPKDYYVSETVAALQALINASDVVNGSTQTLTGAGAVSTTTEITLLVTTGANALTLAAGSEGQEKFIKMKTDGGDGTLTPNALQGGTTITFNDAGDFVKLKYVDAKWNIIINSGCTVA